VQETRRWDDEQGVTTAMRTKEDAHDYRYFPDPDLAEIVLSTEQVEGWRAALPELPAVRQKRFVEEYGLPEYDAGVLVADPGVAGYFEEVVAAADGNAKGASNWIMTEVMRILSETGMSPSELRVTPGNLGKLIGLVDKKILYGPKAKDVFAILVEEGGDPEAVVKEKGWAQVNDSGAIEAFVDQVIAENPGPVADYRGGKKAALQFLMGQVMKLSKGKANPKSVSELLQERLA
jgi:aspartyl-tRNA(Asn)/glutamyl-tRNA(Gln) amidotransferase subunit B